MKLFRWSDKIKKLIKEKKGVELKVQKVYEFRKGGRYYFAITTDKPISKQMNEELHEALKLHKEKLLKELGIISSFIVLDNGLSIKVLPNDDIKKE